MVMLAQLVDLLQGKAGAHAPQGLEAKCQMSYMFVAAW